MQKIWGRQKQPHTLRSDDSIWLREPPLHLWKHPLAKKLKFFSSFVQAGSFDRIKHIIEPGGKQPSPLGWRLSTKSDCKTSVSFKNIHVCSWLDICHTCHPCCSSQKDQNKFYLQGRQNRTDMSSIFNRVTAASIFAKTSASAGL